MALLVIIALLGVSSATLDFFLDAEESRDLGLEGPLYFIQKGELIREALVPIYTHIIPLQKTTIRYKWRARKTRVCLSVVCSRLACLLLQRVVNIDK
jgi:hypothetical protein